MRERERERVKDEQGEVVKKAEEGKRRERSETIDREIEKR